MAKTPVAPRAAKPARATAADGPTAPPVKPKRPRKPKAEPVKTGRPTFKPTDQQRNLVMVLRANGIDPADIAFEIGCSERTLYKYFAEELAHGLGRIRAKIGGVLVKAAFAGNLTAVIFWLKTHGGPGWIVPPSTMPSGGGGDEGGGSTEPVEVTIIGGLPD